MHFCLWLWVNYTDWSTSRLHSLIAVVANFSTYLMWMCDVSFLKTLVRWLFLSVCAYVSVEVYMLSVFSHCYLYVSYLVNLSFKHSPWPVKNIWLISTDLKLTPIRWKFKSYNVKLKQRLLDKFLWFVSPSIQVS